MIVLGNNNFYSIDELAKIFLICQDELRPIFLINNIIFKKIGNYEYVLEEEFLKLFKNDAKLVSEIRVDSTSEKEILAESLKILKEHKTITVSQLRTELKKRMALSQNDMEVLKGRTDTRFDQKVRNLVSHRENNSLADYCTYERCGRDGILILKEELVE